MWISTCHRFPSEAAFRAACDAAGWPRDAQDQPQPPAGVALDILGALPSDARWHVNARWHARDPDPAFTASTVAPATPSRVWA